MIELLAQTDAAGGGFLTEVQSFFLAVAEHWQFCLLHFLEFAIWGAWFVVLGNILNARGFTRKQIGRIYGTLPIGSMITPLFIGAVADTMFNTEVLIGVSHLIGGALLFGMARVRNAKPFYWLTFLYALAFAPTLSLVNSIIFAHNEDIFDGAAGEVFPWIRVFGTLGWIVAGLSHALILKKDQPINERPLLLACGLSVVLGLFSFTLPATAPGGSEPAPSEEAAAEVVETDGTEAGEQAVAGDEATEGAAEAAAEIGNEAAAEEQLGIIDGSIQLLGSYPVFFTVTFVASMAMGLYFAFAALFVEKSGVRANTVGPVMTLGQWIEIFFMLTLPWFLGPDNVYMKYVLFAGVCAWAVRFALFAVGQPLALVLVGIAIHGICFDFFFAAGIINTGAIAPEGLTNTAQTIYGFLVYGLGMYLGSEGSGWLNQFFTKTVTGDDGETTSVTNWRAFWTIPAVILAISAVLFWFTDAA